MFDEKNQQNMTGIFVENIPIILASASPRRHQLLKKLGIAFKIVSVDNEPLPFPNELPENYVMRAAEAKASFVAHHHPDALIIAADTIVTQNNGTPFRIIGKPNSDEDALTILMGLEGKQHQVFSGCCIIWPENTTPTNVRYETFYDSTYVHFGKWSKDILHAYIKTGEAKDKAGAFSIDGIGGFLIDIINGNFTTVLGLPLSEVVRRLLSGGAIHIYKIMNTKK